MIQKQLGHYRVTGELGKGAMGMVLKGVDEKLNMEVAIKVLSPVFANSQENRARFDREAKAAANLKHPHIAHVFFVGRTDDKLPFYAMELIKGPSLEKVIQERNRLTGKQILTLMRQSAIALRFASAREVLHRDIKPGNIMIEETEGVKLVDFGIAKIAEVDTNLTDTGIALGTPNYISPEQARGKRIDFRADMYSLGVTFFELLTGNLPYKADNSMAVIMKHLNDPIPDLNSMNSQYPRSLCKVIEKMIAKDRKDRFKSYDTIISELESIEAREVEFVNSEWTFCENCGYVTRIEPGPVCSICQTPFEPPEKEISYMSVHLTGLKGSDARKNVAHYMKMSTRRPLESIYIMLDNLPLMLSPKLSFDKAKAVQSKLYQLGAEITLKKAGVEKIKTEHSRPTLSLAADNKNVYAQSVNSNRSQISNKSSSSPVKVSLAVLVILLAAAFLLYMYSDKLFDSITPDLENNPTSEKLAEAKIAIEKTKPDKQQKNEPADPNFIEYTSPNGSCRMKGLSLSDNELLKALGSQCEQAIYKIKVATGNYNVPAMRFLVDGRKDSALLKDNFGLNLAENDQEIVVYGKFLKPENSRTSALFIALVARQTLHQIGKGDIPRWYEIGFALHMLQGIHPGIYKADTDKLNTFIAHDKLEQAFEENNPRAFSQSDLFFNYLTSKHQEGSTLRLARLVEQGMSFEDAFMRVYHKSVDDQWEEWQAKYQLAR